MSIPRAQRIALALLLTGAIDFISVCGPKIIGVSKGGFLPPSFVTHTAMWALSLALMGLLSRGQLAAFGFTRGTFKFSSRILLWAIPTAVLAVVSTFAPSGPSGTRGPAEGFTPLQGILFIWVYASASEEILTRGLLQGYLSISEQAVPDAAPRFRLSLPVIISGLFFGAMHVVLIPFMGPAAFPLIVLAVFLGLVAGYYRERTGSLLPAIIVHSLFNIGGSLPIWLIHWLRR